MIGKTVLITGARNGIGFHTALALARKKCRLILADVQDLQPAKEQLIAQTGNTDIVIKTVDLASFLSIRALVRELIEGERRLDVLINNAGTLLAPGCVTDDGIQATMQVNHFGPFLLTYLLTDLLKKSVPSRIIFVSSTGAFLHNLSMSTLDDLNKEHVFPICTISTLLKYYNSKLCNMIVANGFAERLLASGVTANSVHPGMTGTKFLCNNKWFNRYLLQTPERGADGNVFLATSKSLDGVTGEFFVDYRRHCQPLITQDRVFCDEIWRYSGIYTNLSEDEKKLNK